MYYFTPFGSLIKTYEHFELFLKQAFLNIEKNDKFSIVQDSDRGKDKQGNDCTKCFNHLKFQCLYDYVNFKCYNLKISNEQKISCCLGRIRITTPDGFVVDCTELLKYDFISLNNKLASMGVHGYKHKRLSSKAKVEKVARGLQGF